MTIVKRVKNVNGHKYLIIRNGKERWEWELVGRKRGDND